MPGKEYEEESGAWGRDHERRERLWAALGVLSGRITPANVRTQDWDDLGMGYRVNLSDWGRVRDRAESIILDALTGE